MFGSIRSHERCCKLMLDIIAVARPDCIEVQALQENPLGHNRAEVALGDQAHEWERIDDLVKATGLAPSGDDGVVVRTERRGRVAHDERAISLVYPDMGEDPAIGVVRQRMVT